MVEDKKTDTFFQCVPCVIPQASVELLGSVTDDIHLIESENVVIEELVENKRFINADSM